MRYIRHVFSFCAGNEEGRIQACLGLAWGLLGILFDEYRDIAHASCAIVRMMHAHPKIHPSAIWFRGANIFEDQQQEDLT